MAPNGPDTYIGLVLTAGLTRLSESCSPVMCCRCSMACSLRPCLLKPLDMALEGGGMSLPVVFEYCVRGLLSAVPLLPCGTVPGFSGAVPTRLSTFRSLSGGARPTASVSARSSSLQASVTGTITRSIRNEDRGVKKQIPWSVLVETCSIKQHILNIYVEKRQSMRAIESPF